MSLSFKVKLLKEKKANNHTQADLLNADNVFNAKIDYILKTPERDDDDNDDFVHFAENGSHYNPFSQKMQQFFWKIRLRFALNTFFYGLNNTIPYNCIDEQIFTTCIRSVYIYTYSGLNVFVRVLEQNSHASFFFPFTASSSSSF